MPCLAGNVCRGKQEGQAVEGSRAPFRRCSTHRAAFWVPGEVSGWSLPFFPHYLLSWKMLGRIKPAQFSSLWCHFGFCSCLPALKESVFLDVLVLLIEEFFSDFWKDKDMPTESQHFGKWDTSCFFPLLLDYSLLWGCGFDSLYGWIRCKHEVLVSPPGVKACPK